MTSLTAQITPKENEDLFKLKKGPMGPLRRYTKPVTGSRKRKVSTTFSKIDIHNSTKPSSLHDSQESNCDAINCSLSSSLDKHSTSSASSCVSSVINSSTSQANGEEKNWNDSGLES